MHNAEGSEHSMFCRCHLIMVLESCLECLSPFPFLRLALLWFHTIVRPFFGLDGSNLKSGADAAQRLIEASRPEFARSALFLFFQGRVERLKVSQHYEVSFLPSRLILLVQQISVKSTSKE